MEGLFMSMLMKTPLLWLGFLQPRLPLLSPIKSHVTSTAKTTTTEIITNFSPFTTNEMLNILSQTEQSSAKMKHLSENFTTRHIIDGITVKPAALSREFAFDPPLIPRELLIGDADYSNVQLSPDGKFLSYLKHYKNSLNLWITKIPIEHSSNYYTDKLQELLLTREQQPGIQSYSWLYDNSTIIYKTSATGQLFRVDTKTAHIKPVVFIEGIDVLFMAKSRYRPHQIIVGLNDRTPDFYDPYLLDTRNGRRQIIFKNDMFSSFVFDHSLKLRLAMNISREETLVCSYYYYHEKTATWIPYRRVVAEDADLTAPLQFDITNRMLYWLDTSSSDKVSLVETEFDYKSARTLFSPSRADITNVLFDSRSETPSIVATKYDRAILFPLTAEAKADIQFLQTVAPGDIYIEHTSVDYQKWIVRYETDSKPSEFYMYDRQHGQSKYIFSANKRLSLYTMSRMHTMEVRTRDNLTEVCYVSVPINKDLNQDGVPAAPIPMVVLAHDGFTDRASWGFRPDHQLLLNRGYATLSCNHRGSTGYGKSFLNAADYEWGAKVHGDIIDAVKIMIDMNITRKDKIAMMGTNFGGYAALVGLTFTPEVFACGIDYSGPANLLSIMKNVPGEGRSTAARLVDWVGDPTTDEGAQLILRRSPLFFADRIQKPLLIVDGGQNPWVNKSETRQIVDSLKTNGIPVTYLNFPDEGMEILRQENRMAFYGVVELFLQHCLDGRAEPIKEFTKSSVEILEEGELSELSHGLVMQQINSTLFLSV